MERFLIELHDADVSLLSSRVEGQTMDLAYVVHQRLTPTTRSEGEHGTLVLGVAIDSEGAGEAPGEPCDPSSER